jgi:hypothetical protein
MTTRYRLSPPALDRLAEIVGDDGCATAEEIERALSASTSTTSTTTTGEPDEAYARRALAAMGIEEDDGDARTFAALDEEDAAYLGGYAADLGLTPDECVTVEVRRWRRSQVSRPTPQPVAGSIVRRARSVSPSCRL